MRAKDCGSLLTQGLDDLVTCPNIKSPFSMFRLASREEAVCVFGGIETALSARHVPPDLLQNVAGDFCEDGLTSDLIGFQV